MLKPIRTSIILTLGLLATAGCSSWQSMCPEFVPLGSANGLDYRKCPLPAPPPLRLLRWRTDWPQQKKNFNRVSSGCRW